MLSYILSCSRFCLLVFMCIFGCFFQKEHIQRTDAPLPSPHPCSGGPVRETLKKLHLLIEIPSYLGYGSKSLKYKASMHRLKSILFANQNCYLIISYWCHIKWFLLGIMVFLVMGRVAEIIELKNKPAEEKHWKMKIK